MLFGLARMLKHFTPGIVSLESSVPMAFVRMMKMVCLSFRVCLDPYVL